MNLRKTRNNFLALTGLAALFVCILACTSFSPDDKKILFSTFDPKSRSMGVAVYDRASRESRLLFASKAILEPGDEPPLLRSQWLADGKNIVITWPPLRDAKEGESVVTSFAMLPLEGKEPVRLLHLARRGDMSVYWPLPMAGTRLYVNTESNIITTLDLLTGEARVRTNSDQLMLLASSVPGRLGFMGEIGDEQYECGLLNPETMTKEWRVQIEEHKSSDKNKSDSLFFLAFSPVGKKVVFSPYDPSSRGSSEPILKLYEEGHSPRPVPVPAAEAENLNLGQVEFSPDGRSLVVTFESEAEGKTGHSFGVIELPLDGRPPRRTVLIREVEINNHDEDLALGLFQFGLSHDGKALAVSTAYLAAQSKHFRTDDCALFIVNLASAKRTVTRIPIPLPVGAGTLLK